MSDDLCPRCRRPMEPLFHSNKMKWCPNCEGHKTKVKDFPDEKTEEIKPKKQLELDIFDLSFDPEKWDDPNVTVTSVCFPDYRSFEEDLLVPNMSFRSKTYKLSQDQSAVVHFFNRNGTLEITCKNADVLALSHLTLDKE